MNNFKNTGIPTFLYFAGHTGLKRYFQSKLAMEKLIIHNLCSFLLDKLLRDY